MTDEEKIQAIYQAVFGVPDSEDKGMVGDIKDIKTTVVDVCTDQFKLKLLVYCLIFLLIGAGVLEITGVLQLL